MVILGLLVVLVALLLGLALIAGALAPEVSGEELDISFFDTVTVSLSPLALVVAGMAAMFLLWVGLWMIKAALARKRRVRHDRKDHERRVAAEREQERLAAQERERGYREQLDERERVPDRDGPTGDTRAVDSRDRDAVDRGDRGARGERDDRGPVARTRDRLDPRVDDRGVDRGLDRGVDERPVGDTQRIDPRDGRR